MCFLCHFVPFQIHQGNSRTIKKSTVDLKIDDPQEIDGRSRNQRSIKKSMVDQKKKNDHMLVNQMTLLLMNFQSPLPFKMVKFEEDSAATIELRVVTCDNRTDV